MRLEATKRRRSALEDRELLGERRPATVIEDSPYDPANRRPRM